MQQDQYTKKNNYNNIERDGMMMNPSSSSYRFYNEEEEHKALGGGGGGEKKKTLLQNAGESVLGIGGNKNTGHHNVDKQIDSYLENQKKNYHIDNIEYVTNYSNENRNQNISNISDLFKNQNNSHRRDSSAILKLIHQSNYLDPNQKKGPKKPKETLDIMIKKRLFEKKCGLLATVERVSKIVKFAKQQNGGEISDIGDQDYPIELEWEDDEDLRKNSLKMAYEEECAEIIKKHQERNVNFANDWIKEQQTVMNSIKDDLQNELKAPEKPNLVFLKGSTESYPLDFNMNLYTYTKEEDKNKQKSTSDNIQYNYIDPLKQHQKNLLELLDDTKLKKKTLKLKEKQKKIIISEIREFELAAVEADDQNSEDSNEQNNLNEELTQIESEIDFLVQKIEDLKNSTQNEKQIIIAMKKKFIGILENLSKIEKNSFDKMFDFKMNNKLTEISNQIYTDFDTKKKELKNSIQTVKKNFKEKISNKLETVEQNYVKLLNCLKEWN